MDPPVLLEVHRRRAGKDGRREFFGINQQTLFLGTRPGLDFQGIDDVVPPDHEIHFGLVRARPVIEITAAVRDEFLGHIVFDERPAIFREQAVTFHDRPLGEAQPRAEESDIEKIDFEGLVLAVAGKRQFGALDVMALQDQPRVGQPLERFGVIPRPGVLGDVRIAELLVLLGQLPGHGVPDPTEADRLGLGRVLGEIVDVRVQDRFLDAPDALEVSAFGVQGHGYFV